MLMFCFVRKPSLTGTQNSKVWNFSDRPRQFRICSAKYFFSYRDIYARKRAKTPPKRARLTCFAQKCLCFKFTYVPSSRLAKEQSRDFISILFTGIVLGSFYYGYAFLQIPGGYLALKLGGTRIFGYAIFLASMLTLLTPVATRYSVYGLIAVRAGEGLMLVCREYFFYCETLLCLVCSCNFWAWV